MVKLFSIVIGDVIQLINQGNKWENRAFLEGVAE